MKNFTKQILLFIFLLGFSNINAQDDNIREYDSFDFENYFPAWKHVVFDTSIAGKYVIRPHDTLYYDGWSHYNMTEQGQNILIYNNNLYLVHLLLKNGFEGSFIEKMDINTGQVLWSNFTDFRNNDRKEWPFYSYINTDGGLEIAGVRQLYNEFPKLPDPLWGAKAVLFVRKYDIDSGDLLDFTFGDENNPSTQIISSFLTGFVGQSKFLMPSGEDRYQYIDEIYKSNSVTDTNQNVYLFKNMDDSGMKINDTTISEIVKLVPKKVKLVNIGKDSLVSFIYSSGSDSFNVKLKIFGSDFSKVTELDLTDRLIPQSQYDLQFIDKNFLILIGKHSVKIGDVNYDGSFNMLFDMDGNLLETVYQTDENNIPVTPHSVSTKLKYEDGIIVVSKIQLSGGYWALNFYKSDGKGNLILKKSLKINQKNHVLIPFYIYQLNSGDILLGCKDRNTNMAEPYNEAVVWMKILAGDLDLKTSFKDIPFIQETVSIFPNPAKTELNIEFSANFSGELRVYDVLGRTLISQNVNNTNWLNINISNLIPGIYYIKTFDISSEKVFGTARFVKE